MHTRDGVLAGAFAALVLTIAHATVQQPPQPPPQPAPQQPPPQPGGRQGRGRGNNAVFPAQQRPPGDPAVVERGRTLYGINCSPCHGADARGGQLGGPNLLRSQVVLSDQNGELILPIVRGARAAKGMPGLPLPDDDVKAVAEFMHSLTAAAERQGAPPPSGAPEPDILVGDAAAGQAYFTAKCASCHSSTGDLQGIAAKAGTPKALQNLWVSGGGRGRGFGPESDATAATVAVTLPSGEKVEGRLVRIDDFLVTLAQADGTVRSFRRDGDEPAVEVRDPVAAHRTLLTVLTDKDMHDVTAYLVTLK